jgi:hypothetical protein
LTMLSNISKSPILTILSSFSSINVSSMGPNFLRNTKILSCYYLLCIPLHNLIWPCKNTKWMRLMESKIVVV